MASACGMVKMASLLRRCGHQTLLQRVGNSAAFRRHASSHASTNVSSDSIWVRQREPPNGFLFNEKPLKPGEKRQWEDWEATWYIGWGTAIAVGVLGFLFRPDDDNLQKWAHREALKRIAEIEAAEASSAEGVAED